MTDFHAHLLPGIDDGSDSTETSLAMLEMWRRQQIHRIAATPHFYADRTDPRRFLKQRGEAYEVLRKAMDSAGVHAELILGAEVHYFSGMSNSDALDELCLSGTRLLLLEMPFTRTWTESMLRETEALRRRGLIPVAAHIERYIQTQPRHLVRQFMDLDIFFQSNAEFFLSRRSGRNALRLLKEGRIHFLGSDAHNASTRPPNLGKALALIGEKLGGGALSRLEDYDRLTYPEGGAAQ